MESGRVLAAWSHSVYFYEDPRTVIDATGGEWNELIAPDFAEFDWGTTYEGVIPAFLPNAVAWRTGEAGVDGGSGFDEGGELEPFADGLAILPDDGSDVPLRIAGATNAVLLAKSGARLLWTERRGGSFALVLGDTNGVDRVDVAVAEGVDFDGGDEVVAGMFGGIAADGVFWEQIYSIENGVTNAVLKFRDWEGNVSVLDEGEARLDEWGDWAHSPASAHASVGFHPVPYRGGVAWLRENGQTGEDGEPRCDLRVRLGGDVFTVATGVLPGGGYADLWDSPVPIVSCDVCTANRLAFERVSDGTRQLCVWDGETAGDAPAVLARGYSILPRIVVNVNREGAAAAVNMGTADEPDYRVVAAYGQGAVPEIIDLPAATEMVAYSAMVFEAGTPARFVAGGNQGFGVDATGCVTGLPTRAGTRSFRIDQSGDSDGHGEAYRLIVRENENRPPVLVSATPAPGIANFGPSHELVFSVDASDPEGATPLKYRWFVDGEEMPGSKDGAGQDAGKPSFTLTRDAGDVSAHRVMCVVEDDLWTLGAAGADAVSAEWLVGVLAVESASATDAHVGQRAELSVIVESTIEFADSGYSPAGYDETEWFDAGTGESIGRGNRIMAPEDGSGTYYAVITTTYGEARTEDVVVSLNPAPEAGMVFCRTGPAVVGNRCVLHAGAWGEKPLSFAWTLDGALVSTSQTLDIPALAASDFGSYVLSVSNAHGVAFSALYALKPAPRGVVACLPADSASSVEDVSPPAALSDVVQVAALPVGGVALHADGTIFSWSDADHDIGDAPGIDDAMSVAASHCGPSYDGIGAAVRRDGTVVTWGEGAANPAGMSNVVQIALSPSTGGYALHADGTVSRFGKEYSLYDDVEIERDYVETLDGIAGAVSVSCQDWTVAITLDDGSVIREDGGTIPKLKDCRYPRSIAGDPLDEFEDCWLAVDGLGRVHTGEAADCWEPSVVASLSDAVAADVAAIDEWHHRGFVLTADGDLHAIGICRHRRRFRDFVRCRPCSGPDVGDGLFGGPCAGTSGRRDARSRFCGD